MDNVRPDALGDVLVLGLGHTGQAVARYLLHLADDPATAARVGSVTVVGGAKSSDGPAARALRAAGAAVTVGEDSVEGSYDLCVASPGISEFSDLFAAGRAASGAVVGEPELVWRESPERWIAITGTNGKTTTTSLATALLTGAGIDAVSVGNIGTNLADALDAGRPAGRWYVTELSSFQLATTERLHPRVACLLNVTPDHLEWHRTFDGYVAAKERVFANLDPSDLAVLVVDDPVCARVADGLEARGLTVCRVSVEGVPDAPCRAYLDGDTLTVDLPDGTHRLADFSAMALEGPHNAANALVASACALFAGAPDDAVTAGLVAFGPLEHRIEPVRTVDGVRYVNDSKATNTDAAVTAVGAFAPGTVVCLVGGHDKGGDLADFCRAMGGACRAVVAYGEARARMGGALEEAGVPVTYAPHMAEALEAARALVRPGDVVLLSPACSSFDEFSGYEERGRAFKDLVRALVPAGGRR